MDKDPRIRGAEGSMPALSPGQRGLSLGAVILSMLGVGLTLGSSYPLTALILERWGESSTLIGVSGAMVPLAVLLIMPFAPGLIGRLGTVPTMVMGCAIGSLALLAMPLLPDPMVWLVLRFLMGVGIAFPLLVGETWINTVATDAIRGRVVATYAAAFFAGFGSGSLLLGAVGLEGWPPFLVVAGALLLAMLPLVLVYRLAPPIELHAETGLSRAFGKAPVVMVAAFVAGFTEILSFSLLSVYGLRTGLTEGEALLLLSVVVFGGVILQAPIGWAADRFSRTGILAAIGVGLVAFAALLPLVLPLGRIGLVVAFLLGGMVLGTYSIGLAVLGESYAPGELAVANAAFLMLYQLGGLIGPPVSGFSMSVWPPHGFIAMLVLAGLGLALFVLLRRTLGSKK